MSVYLSFFFQAEDGIRDLVRSRGLGDVYKRQELMALCGADLCQQAVNAGVNLAMEASVAGGIPIHLSLIHI